MMIIPNQLRFEFEVYRHNLFYTIPLRECFPYDHSIKHCRLYLDKQHEALHLEMEGTIYWFYDSCYHQYANIVENKFETTKSLIYLRFPHTYLSYFTPEELTKLFAQPTIRENMECSRIIHITQERLLPEDYREIQLGKIDENNQLWDNIPTFQYGEKMTIFL